MTISDLDKRVLLSVARTAIFNQLVPAGIERQLLPDSNGALNLCGGAFVSLYVDDKLRGCIGTFSEANSIFMNVKQMAESAAVSDSRFTPIEFSEIGALKIEISILTPREPVRKVDEIIPGKHGIYMEKGMNRGTLLPQVATSQKWSVEDLLGNCAKYKAGIGWNGWKKADLYRYEAMVFSSDDLPPDC